MWVLKTHGVTFYVNHVTAEIPWTTKETPNNSHTKGSLKFKKCKLSIDDDNCATISKLGILDRNLPSPTRKFIRILCGYGNAFHKAIERNEYEHSKIKQVYGGCGTSFIICDLYDEAQVTLAALKYPNQFRILNPNEGYYKAYDNKEDWIDEDEFIDFEDE